MTRELFEQYIAYFKINVDDVEKAKIFAMVSMISTQYHVKGRNDEKADAKAAYLEKMYGH